MNNGAVCSNSHWPCCSTWLVGQDVDIQSVQESRCWDSSSSSISGAVLRSVRWGKTL